MSICVTCTDPIKCQSLGLCKGYTDEMCTGPSKPTKADPNIAIKEDGGKNRVDLLPIQPLEDIAEVLTFGAQKYADHNWRGGFKWSRLYGALFRHMFAWIKGQDKDPETGLSHLAHAGCCILFLLEHEKRKLGEDDRYKVIEG